MAGSAKAQSPSDPATWYGLDSEGLRLMGPQWNDIMSYCQDLWISDYTYRALYQTLINRFGPGQNAAQAAAPKGQRGAPVGVGFGLAGRRRHPAAV